jgi:RNA polymerase sigma-70 factor (ECF subfamily)
MSNGDDLIIISKVLAGDVVAYSVLVNRYRNMVFTLAYNIILNREDAEEVAQDAFVKAYRSLSLFKEYSKFSTWLYRIVVNTSLNKKKLKKFNILTIEEQLTDEMPNDIYPLLHKYENKEQRKFIQLALDALNEGERICITLYYLNELSVSEINELTGISTANIKVLLYRGRKHIFCKLNSLLKHEIKNLM